MDRQTDGWMDGLRDRQGDRQAEMDRTWFTVVSTEDTVAGNGPQYFRDRP